MEKYKCMLIVTCWVGAAAGAMTKTRPGNNIVIGAFEIPPVMYSKVGADGNRTYRGTLIDMADFMFGASQNLSYTLVPVSPIEVTRVGMATASFNQAVDRQVDLCVVGMVPTNERTRLADFPFPYYFTEYRLLQPYPKEQGRLLAAVKPFQPLVWLLIFIIFFAVVGHLTLLFLYENRTDPTTGRQTLWQLFGLNAIYCYTVLIGQGNSISSPKLNIRIVAAVWCLMTVVLANSFSGQLTSFLTTPTFEPIVNSFEDLAESKNIKLAIEANSVMGETFLNAKSGTFKKLGDSLRANPENYFKTRPEFLQLLPTGKIAYPGMGLITSSYVDNGWRQTNKKECPYTLSDPVSFFQFLCLVLPKDSPWTEFVNMRVYQLAESGLPSYDHVLTSTITTNDLVRTEQCMVANAPKSHPSPLKLKDLSISFIVLGIGTGLSLIVFICENITRLRNRRLQLTKKKTRAENIINE